MLWRCRMRFCYPEVFTYWLASTYSVHLSPSHHLPTSVAFIISGRLLLTACYWISLVITSDYKWFLVITGYTGYYWLSPSLFPQPPASYIKAATDLTHLEILDGVLPFGTDSISWTYSGAILASDSDRKNTLPRHITTVCNESVWKIYKWKRKTKYTIYFWSFAQQEEIWTN